MAMGSSHAAHAQGSAAAESLFREGRVALDAGDLDKACRLLRESDRLDSAVGTKLNLADCEHKRGRIATAWALFQIVAGDPDAGEDRASIARSRVEELEPRIPKLTLNLAPGAPTDTVAVVGELELRSAGFGAPVSVDPGAQKLVVRAPGHEDRIIDINLAEAEQKELVVSPGPVKEQAPAAVAPSEPPTPEAPPPVAEPADRGSSLPTVGWILATTGVVFVGAGAVMGAVALGEKSTGDEHCRDDLQLCDQEGADANDSARTFATLSTVGFITGGVLVASGLSLVLFGGDDEPDGSAVSLHPGIGTMTLRSVF